MSGGQAGSTKDDDNYYGRSIVHVEGIEKGREAEDPSEIGHVGKKEKESDLYVHDGENIRTTYDVEEENPISALYQKMKEKLVAHEGTFRSKLGRHSRSADPQSEVNYTASAVEAAHKPNVVAERERTGWGGKHDTNTAKRETTRKNEEKETKVARNQLERFESAKETFDIETTEDKKVRDGDELGTGYEEGSEEGGISPSSSSPLDGLSLPKESSSVFKPEKSKDQSELTLEALRASKLNENSSAEDVKAPGVIDRAIEEAEALSGKVSEELGLKDKRSASGDQKNSSEGGLFNRIAESLGMGTTHGRSQSH